jgi:outer membrane biosynthesis protein TonB
MRVCVWMLCCVLTTSSASALNTSFSRPHAARPRVAVDTLLLLRALMSEDEAAPPDSASMIEAAAGPRRLRILRPDAERVSPETLSSFTKVYMVSPQRESPRPKSIDPSAHAYEAWAKEGAIGYVVVAVHVDTMGNVMQAGVIYSLVSDARLESVAVSCALKTKFRAHTSDGERSAASRGRPVKSWAALAYVSRFSPSYPKPPYPRHSALRGGRGWPHIAAPCAIDTAALIHAILSEDEAPKVIYWPDGRAEWQLSLLPEVPPESTQTLVRAFAVSPQNGSPQPVDIPVPHDSFHRTCRQSDCLGWAVVAVRVDASGRATQAEVVQGICHDPILETAAVSWAMSARFRPRRWLGIRVNGWAALVYVARHSRTCPLRIIVRT